MTKNLKLNIKNPQIAEAINLKGLKAKLAKQKEEVEASTEAPISVEEKATKAKKKPAAKAATAAAKVDAKKIDATHEAQTETHEESAEKKKRARSKTKEEPAEATVASVPTFSSQPATRDTRPPATDEKKAEENKVRKVEEVSPAVETTKKPDETKARLEPDTAKPQARPSVSATQTPSQYAPRPQPTQSRPSYQSPQSSSQYSQQSSAQRAQSYKEPFPRRQESTGQSQFGTQGQRSATPFKAKPFESKPFEPKPFESKSTDERPSPERRPDSYERRGDSYGNDRGPPRSQGAPYPSSRPQGGAPYPSSRPPYQGQRPQGQYSQDQGRPQGQYPQGSRPPGGPYPSSRPQGGPYPSSRPPYQGQGRPQGSYPPGQGPQGPGQYGPRREGGYPPRREGGFAPPREFGRDTLARHLPPTMKEGLPARTPDDVKKPRGGFGDAPKYKGKAKETTPQKPVKRVEAKAFDTRARHGIVSDEEEGGAWRSRRRAKIQHHTAEVVRPTKVKIRLPIAIKDLAVEMKLKASQLVSKLFIQGLKVTLNDLLDDSTVVALLGHEFGCEIVIDTAEEERIRISDKNVREEIALQDASELVLRPPIAAFMGHVDHGKTSLIDAIRKSNRAAKEVGAITQHIGAFKCATPQGNLTILDTPGHEAFTLMRERGAEITDIVVLVIAGDEGIQEQTVEALKQAKAANATIVVAITKSDKPNFDADLVYRQLADRELLPEAWGGQTVVVKCSAVTGEGIQELLEMLALQAEVLELKANPSQRARGTVIESQMQQGLGAVATVLVQNGTLRIGDALVFGEKWARVKNMHNENGLELQEAPPSTPVQITGLSGMPEAGEEFIVVKNEKEAREIANARQEGKRQSGFQLKKRVSLESMMENAKQLPKKVFTLILRADVQGSLEALVKALEKIHSDKVELNIISQGVGQISESDVQLAATSKACIIGFHTAVETHAESLIKEMGVKVLLHNIIYHVVDAVKLEMKSLLDKLPLEVEKGKAEVKAVFKASQLGTIAGCQVIEGTITRNCLMRVKRGNDIVWKGSIASLKRVKEDVKEVQKGVECGILLANYNDAQVGDILEAYEITYITQDL